MSDTQSGSANPSDVTVITIVPKILGEGIHWQVMGLVPGVEGGTLLKEGSAIGPPVEVSVSGYAEYAVIFVGAKGKASGMFGSASGLPISALSGSATVTLSVDIVQKD